MQRSWAKLHRWIVCCLSVVLLQASVAHAEEIQLARLSPTLQQQQLQPAAIESVMQQLDTRLQKYPKDYEASLLKAVLDFKAGRLQQALVELDQLLQKAPDFHLAHLIRGDLILSAVGTIDSIGQTPLLASLDNEKRTQLNLLREEARVRIWALFDQMEKRALPKQILALGESVEKALLVEKSSNRLFVYQRDASSGQLKLVRDYYVSTGKLIGDKVEKGDLRTPEGVYFVTSWIAPDKLPTKYGVGAFPMNYPNELDRHMGRTGYGIWLHGTDDKFYSRPPRDSEGCVVLTNEDLTSLKAEVIPGITPVVITNTVEWISADEWQQQRASILGALEKWRSDWESMDVEKYLAHYADDFWSSTHDRHSWSTRKRRLAKQKTYQKVDLSDFSIFSYPHKQGINHELVVVRLHQKYASNNFSSDMYKRLYLAREADGWQIMYEGR